MKDEEQQRRKKIKGHIAVVEEWVEIELTAQLAIDASQKVCVEVVTEFIRVIVTFKDKLVFLVAISNTWVRQDMQFWRLPQLAHWTGCTWMATRAAHPENWSRGEVESSNGYTLAILMHRCSIASKMSLLIRSTSQDGIHSFESWKRQSRPASWIAKACILNAERNLREKCNWSWR